MELLAWYAYVTLIWGLKACMLFFFNRLTFGLTQQIFVKALGVVCVLIYIAMFLTITLSCLPYHLNWQVRPMPPMKCAFRKQNFYTCTILNVITDAAILCVPIPLLWRLKIGIVKKLGLGLLLCSGVFVTTAAIVRIIKTVDAVPSALTINRWGAREVFAGICAVNAPILRPMFRRSFWRRNFRLPSTSTVAERTDSGGSAPNKRNGLSKFLRGTNTVELIDVSDKTTTTGTVTKQSMDGGNRKTLQETESDIDASTSQECIVQRPQVAVAPRTNDQVDLEMGLPHPGVRVDSATNVKPAVDDESDAKMGALKEPVVSRPQRVFKTSIGEELDSIRGLPHPGVRIPTPGVREKEQDQYIPDMPSPRVLTPWPENQQFSPWGYDTMLTNMDSIHSGNGHGRSP